MIKWLKDLTGRMTDVVNGRSHSLDEIAQGVVDRAELTIEGMMMKGSRALISRYTFAAAQGCYGGTYVLARSFVDFARARFLLEVPSAYEVYGGHNGGSDKWHYWNVQSAMLKELENGGTDLFYSALRRCYDMICDVLRYDDSYFIGFDLAAEMKSVYEAIENGQMDHEKLMHFRAEHRSSLYEKWGKAIYDVYRDPRVRDFEYFKKYEFGNIKKNHDEFYEEWFKFYMDSIRISDISSGFMWF